VAEELETLVVTSTTQLQRIASRSDPGRVAAEVARLNGVVRDTARPLLTGFEQPADFAAVLLQNRDPAND
jgi:aspartyl-tRNA(Asn)/glutamyl-tRNA(Gln) amidotransferase subunit A